jgi:hypothetical protein
MRNIKLLFLLSLPILTFGQKMDSSSTYGGRFSLGLRSTVSVFGDDGAGLGAGGQFRIQLSKKVNTEWFADYIVINQDKKVRSEYYHIGWSVMFYPFEQRRNLFQPYILAGHCFDYNKMTEIANRANTKNRWGSAVQAGIGTHINLAERLDISVSSQYMMHLTTDLHANTDETPVNIETEKDNALQGHLLTTLSINYKLGHLWKQKNAPKKDGKELIYKGLLSGQATISPSYMFADDAGYFYLHGNMEAYLNKKLSLSGEIYYYLGAQSQASIFDYNHSLFVGPSRHFITRNNDFYLGLQPGVSLAKIKAATYALSETKAAIDPLISAIAGYNYFVNNGFHFFMQTRFITGNHKENIEKGLSELRFSAGLGFNLNTRK